MLGHFQLHFTARETSSNGLTRVFTPTCRNNCGQHEMFEICRSLRKLPYITAAFVVDDKITVTVTSKHIWDNPAHYPHLRLEQLAQYFENQIAAPDATVIQLHPKHQPIAA